VDGGLPGHLPHAARARAVLGRAHGADGDELEVERRGDQLPVVRARAKRPHSPSPPSSPLSCARAGTAGRCAARASCCRCATPRARSCARSAAGSSAPRWSSRTTAR
jgi:hypothetical protein